LGEGSIGVSRRFIRRQAVVGFGLLARDRRAPGIVGRQRVNISGPISKIIPKKSRKCLFVPARG
jgi:hypothetical protein